MADFNPLQRVLSAWQSDQAYSDHVRSIWPDLGKELDALVEWSSHVITSPSSVTVPTVAPAVPRSAPRSHSAARWDRRGDGPTSAGVSTPPWTQDALPLEGE